MSAVWEVVDESGVQVSISAAGRAALADEQRTEQQRDAHQQRAEILMWTTAAAVVALAVLVIKQLIGA